ncbi:hypothetical protein E2562_020075 [Oryza meyeriana var. granulata]|uniref:Uncharacterized protein n=1 Tax=Oryza meyeriana var. granulata TaxID=110450 RepID=A0A6G1EAG6_9ORYZ|nr:hypothetical protein E2562_020075 [Oryza meyeriana var. granulata]
MEEEMRTGVPLWVLFPDCVVHNAGAGGTATHLFRGLRDSPVKFLLADSVDDDKPSRKHSPLPGMKNDAIPDARLVFDLRMLPPVSTAVEKFLVPDAAAVAAARGSNQFRG